MARAYGWNAQLLIAEENEYGVLPEENYRKIPFISSSLDSEQNLVSSNVLGLGRDPTQPFQDVINVDGDMAVPVDMRNIGLWLKAVFGAPVTTDNEDGSFTHTFESGKTSVPSYSLEVGLPEIPQFIRFSGVRANSIAFNFQRSGEAQATINLMAQGESGSETAIDTAPEVYPYTRVSQFQGYIKSGGELWANIVSASATYSNNLEKSKPSVTMAKLRQLIWVWQVCPAAFPQNTPIIFCLTKPELERRWTLSWVISFRKQ